MDKFNRPSDLSLANGTVLTPGPTGNSGGVAGNPFDAVSGTLTKQGDWWEAAGAAGVAIQVAWALQSVDTLQWRGRFLIPAAGDVPTSDMRIVGFWNGSKSSVRVEMRPDLRFVVYDDSTFKFTTPNSAAGKAPVGTSFDIALSAELGASNARIRFALYLLNGGDTTTPSAGATYDTATNITGSAPWTDVRFPKVNSTPAGKIRFGDMHVTDLSSALLAPLPPVLPPAVSLGEDRDVEPGELITLTAEHTSGAAPDSWTWDGTLGPHDVTIIGSGDEVQIQTPTTFDGTTIIVGVTPVADGVSGSQDTVTLTVRPHHHWWTVNPGGTLSNPVEFVEITSDPLTPGSLLLDSGLLDLDLMG